MKESLAELEAVVLQHHLDAGYKLEKDQKEGDTKWGFSVSIESRHKDKKLWVQFYKNGEQDVKLYFHGETTKEMFDRAMRHFRA